MEFEKRTFENGVTPLNADLFNHLQDGIVEAFQTAKNDLTEHNVSEESHNDIRLLINGLADRLNALADSDDTTLDELSEIVAYIKNNKTLIDSITTSKVNVADIIDNVTTNVATKPLSAAQGVVLRQLIYGLENRFDDALEGLGLSPTFLNENKSIDDFNAAYQAFSTSGKPIVWEQTVNTTVQVTKGKTVRVSPFKEGNYYALKVSGKFEVIASIGSVGTGISFMGIATFETNTAVDFTFTGFNVVADDGIYMRTNLGDIFVYNIQGLSVEVIDVLLEGNVSVECVETKHFDLVSSRLTGDVGDLFFLNGSTKQIVNVHFEEDKSNFNVYYVDIAPTKTSQLTNDAGFLKSADLTSKAESWTFKLKDGSTVTKKVVLA